MEMEERKLATWMGCLLTVWFMQNHLGSKHHAHRFQKLDWIFPLSAGLLEGKGSFGNSHSREIILFHFPVCSFWVTGLAKGCQSDSPLC